MAKPKMTPLQKAVVSWLTAHPDTSQRALAEKAGVDGGSMSRIVSGEKLSLAMESAGRLAEAMGLTVEDLLAGRSTGSAPADVRMIDIAAIDPSPHNPRKTIDEAELADLAASIAEQGLLQPLIVMNALGAPGRFELIAGHRRLRAMEINKAAQALCVVRSGATTSSSRALQIIENLQRVDIAPLEEAQAFANQLASVGHAQSNEETRYYLNGIYLHRRAPRELVAVATNGHVLARTVLTVAEDLPEFPGAIIPRETVAELVALAEEAGTIVVEIGETMLRAEAGDTVLTSKLVDGTFPDYERVIPPADIRTGFDVGREALTQAVKRVGVFATDKGKSRPVRFTPEGRTVALLGRSDGEGEISDEIDAQGTAGADPVGMNARYVLAALESLGGTDTQIRYANAGAPIVFIDPAEPSRLQIVMAMRT